MRFSPTASESLIWERIRARKLGVVFRRQVPLLGRFIADFLAPAQRLVVEIDGGYHARYRVLRLDADLVLRDIETAVSRLCEALGE